MKNSYLLCIAVILSFAVACDKSSSDDDGLSFEPEDYARCAHINRDSAMGQWLHSVCLANPWPTELPPATREGLSTFGCWINDTLAFVAGDPRELPRNQAWCNHLVSTGGGGDIFAKTGNYQSISNRAIHLNLSFTEFDAISVSEFARLYIWEVDSLSGTYRVDTSKSTLNFTKFSDGIASGTFDLTFFKPNTSDTLHLTEGRFDVRINQF